MVINDLRGKELQRLFMTAIPLLALVTTLSIWILKFNFSSRMNVFVD